MCFEKEKWKWVPNKINFDILRCLYNEFDHKSNLKTLRFEVKTIFRSNADPSHLIQGLDNQLIHYIKNSTPNFNVLMNAYKCLPLK